MSVIKNLADVPANEQRQFLNSFKQVFLDIDGVIWIRFDVIEGAVGCTENLRKLGKTLLFVTNNGFDSLQTTKDQLKAKGVNENINITHPPEAIAAYLEQIQFKKKLYVVGSSAFKNSLRDKGYILVPDVPNSIGDSSSNFLDEISDDVNVGAVILDTDFNLSRLMLQKALTYLKRSDCLFLVASNVLTLTFGGAKGPLIGNKHFFETITTFSGREFLQISKPTVEFANYLTKRFSVDDPSTVLFIGDSIADDMAFAQNAGFQKLLVLSGISKLSDVTNWKYPEEYKPQYYVNSLNDLRIIIDKSGMI